jgi:hypothetical protein
MDSIGDVLGKKDFTPPDEIALIKDYILRRYKSYSTVKLQNGNLVVGVKNSALAATIHLERQRLIESCGIKDKKLIIRTGSA